MPELSNVIVRQSDGTPLVEIRWNRDDGTGRLRYLRENMEGLSVAVNEEMAKTVLSQFAERGCSFEVIP